MDEIILDFIEENWEAFLLRCKENGLSESEVEEEINKMKEK